MQVSRPILRTFLFRKGIRNYYDHGHTKLSTVDDLPVPQGSWQDAYNAKQRKYNLQLLLGIGFTIFSLTVAKASGLVYLNYSPPNLPKN